MLKPHLQHLKQGSMVHPPLPRLGTAPKYLMGMHQPMGFRYDSQVKWGLVFRMCKSLQLHVPAVEKVFKKKKLKELGGTYPPKHTLHTPSCILWTQN